MTNAVAEREMERVPAFFIAKGEFARLRELETHLRIIGEKDLTPMERGFLQRTLSNVLDRYEIARLHGRGNMSGRDILKRELEASLALEASR